MTIKPNQKTNKEIDGKFDLYCRVLKPFKTGIEDGPDIP